jgi:hypothetical protein
MIRLHPSLTGAIVLGLVQTAAAQAENWCELDDQPWVDVTPIRWKLNVDFWTDQPEQPPPGNFCTQNGCDATQLRRAFEDVFAEIHNASGGNVRFLYAGTTSAEPGTPDPGFLVIYPDTKCPIGDALADATTGPFGNPTTWGLIRICSNWMSSPFGINWNPWSRTDGFSLHLTALHETLHILGMGHPETCGATDASIMRDAPHVNAPSQHMTNADIAFLHSRYPDRPATAMGRHSDDALSWIASGTPPSTVAYQASRFAATNNSTAESVFVAWMERTTAFGDVPLLRVSRRNPGWTNLWGVSSTSFARYHPAIAASDYDSIRVAYGSSYTPTTGEYHLLYYHSNDGGSTWPTSGSITTSKTEMPGVAGTWNAGVGIQGGYVWMWRINGDAQNNGRIAYKIGSNSPVTNWDVEASDTPSIACGPANIGNGYNCVVAIASTTEWGHRALWTQCSASGAQLICFPFVPLNAYTVGTPSVAYSGYGTAYPWHISVNQGGYTTYTWRKGESPAASWQDQVSFVEGNKSILPASGSRYMINAQAPFTTARRYVFVPSF